MDDVPSEPRSLKAPSPGILAGQELHRIDCSRLALKNRASKKPLAPDGLVRLYVNNFHADARRFEIGKRGKQPHAVNNSRTDAPELQQDRRASRGVAGS
jgi:hypothetical protein